MAFPTQKLYRKLYGKGGIVERSAAGRPQAIVVNISFTQYLPIMGSASTFQVFFRTSDEYLLEPLLYHREIFQLVSHRLIFSLQKQIRSIMHVTRHYPESVVEVPDTCSHARPWLKTASNLSPMAALRLQFIHNTYTGFKYYE